MEQPRSNVSCLSTAIWRVNDLHVDQAEAASSMNTKDGRVQEKSVLVHWYLFSFFSELTIN